MAGGHRCSLRHNVCHPATKAYTRIYNCENIYTPSVAATSFFIHRTEIFDFVVRWDKKVYRRQYGRWVEIFLEHIRMDEIINGFWFYISFALRCWWEYKFERHNIWRWDSQNPPLQQHALTYIKKHLGDGLFPRYFVAPHSSLKWMNNAALEEATNRGVLVNTSQVGNFWKAS